MLIPQQEEPYILCMLFQISATDLIDMEIGNVAWHNLITFEQLIHKLGEIVERFILTHCGLVTPYGDKDLGQYRLR